MRLWDALGALFGTSRTLFWYLELIWSSFECLLVSSDPPLPPKNNKNQRTHRCFWRVPKVALGMPFSSLLILWLSFWLPLAPSFRCLRNPLWCPKGPLGLSLRLWDALGALFGTSRALCWYLELIWGSLGCLLVSSDPPLPPKTNRRQRTNCVFGESPKSLWGCLLAHCWS